MTDEPRRADYRPIMAGLLAYLEPESVYLPPTRSTLLPAPDATVRKPAVENGASDHTLMISPSAEHARPS